MQLVIVESPTKAKKLRDYLGSEYEVEASFGHVRDLPKSTLGVDLDKQFEPIYEVSQGKNKVITLLKKLAKTADRIILATDPDREGEAIAWHLKELVGKGEYVRAVFHEITKTAVLDAMAHPGVLNMDLVDAQQARRVVDRLAGYKISPILWRKIRRGLSAGRVQSVALRLIVEREKEIESFQPKEYWELDVALSLNHGVDPQNFFDKKLDPADLPKDMIIARVVELAGKSYKPTAAADVQPLTEWLPQAKYLVSSIDKKERKAGAFPPFTTSTLQQAAANRLSMTSKQTMKLAQDLYEQGLITYHRTDSFFLSISAVMQAREYITKEFGSEYLPPKPNFYANKAKNAQEAHEAIRVTDVGKDEVGLSPRHQKLYDLIRRRFLASQMSQALYDQTTITISATHNNQQAALKTTGSVLRFPGWRKLFPAGDDVFLPEISADEVLYFAKLMSEQKFTQPPPRYNDASLVKELEKRGIGRPSTYAPTISLIEDRGYIERKDKKFFPTTIGTTVCEFLVKHFTQLLQYEFTAQMENDLDEIAEGNKNWREFVQNFYQDFALLVEKTQTEAERVQIPVEETGEECPDCGAEHGGRIVIRTGKFGKFKSCHRFPECKFTQNLVETIDGLNCPVCGLGQVAVKRSRWGRQFYGCSRYPECNWAGPKPPQPGETISADQWEVMKLERAERSKKFRARFSKKPKKTTKKSAKKSLKKTKKAATK